MTRYRATTKSFPLFLLVWISTGGGAAAQRCEHTDLSKNYNYITSTVKAKAADTKQEKTSEVHLRIIEKASKTRIQEIVVKPGQPHGLFDEFMDCSAVRSYITGRNKNIEAEDNDFGDFVVADFNFDNREDFAIKDDSGGNGGPTYEYYIQDKSGRFHKDSFLSARMGFFPVIDSRRKRLITYVHADVAGHHESVFKYNPATGKWTSLKPIYRKNY